MGMLDCEMLHCVSSRCSRKICMPRGEFPDTKGERSHIERERVTQIVAVLTSKHSISILPIPCHFSIIVASSGCCFVL